MRDEDMQYLAEAAKRDQQNQFIQERWEAHCGEVRRDGKLSESRYDFIQYYLNQADDELTPLFPVAHPDESEAST